MTAGEMFTLRLRYVQEDVDRHGNRRIYFRRPGCPRTRLHETPGTEEFSKRYHELLRASEDGKLQAPAQAVKPGTYRWLCCQYLGSEAYRRLDPSTQRSRRLILDATCAEPIAPNEALTFADFPLSRITTKYLRVLRDRKATTGGGNARVKAIKAVFKFGLEDEHITSNPARDLHKLPSPKDGFHSWTIEEVAQFEAHHPVGSKARLAMALLMYTGVRRSDVVQLGRQHAPDGWLRFRAHKNRNRHPVVIEIPVLAELQEIIDATPTGNMTFLTTKFGKPYSIVGFSNQMRRWCDAAGLPHCSAHGLRKAGAAMAAENGATEHQLMSIFGWATSKEAETYTKSARRKKMAGDAMGLVRSKR